MRLGGSGSPLPLPLLTARAISRWISGFRLSFGGDDCGPSSIARPHCLNYRLIDGDSPFGR